MNNIKRKKERKGIEGRIKMSLEKFFNEIFYESFSIFLAQHVFKLIGGFLRTF